MIGDYVQIEIPAESSELDAKRVEGACDAALGTGHCEVGQGDLLDFAPQWIAQVQKDAAGALVIELRPHGEPAERAQRRLEFSESDPAAYRFQSVGVVVAAMVLAQPEPSETGTQEPTVSASGTSEQPIAATVTEPRRGSVALDLAACLGPGVTSGFPSLGGCFGAIWELPIPLLIVADVEVTGSRGTSGTASLQGIFVSAGLGLGQRFLFSERTGLEAQLEGSLQTLGVRAKDSLAAQSETTFRPGARLGLTAFSRFHSRWGAFLGGELGVYSPAVTFQVDGQEASRFSNIWWNAQLGIRTWLLP